MGKKDDERFEMRRKGIEAIFDLLFLFLLFYFIGTIVFEDVTLSIIISRLETLLLLFACCRLSHNGDFFAGILGIVFGIVQFLYGGLILKVLGLLLAFDSILFLLFFLNNDKKTDTTQSK